MIWKWRKWGNGGKWGQVQLIGKWGKWGQVQLIGKWGQVQLIKELPSVSDLT